MTPGLEAQTLMPIRPTVDPDGRPLVELRPGVAAVVGPVYGAGHPARGPVGETPYALPHRGEHGVGPAGVDRDVGRGRGVGDRQHPLPGCAGVDGSVNAPLGVGAEESPGRGHPDTVAVEGINHDPGYVVSVFEAGIVPGRAGVS